MTYAVHLVGAVWNRTIGVNLGTFDEALATTALNMPPLQGLEAEEAHFYKHAVPTGLKNKDSVQIFTRYMRCLTSEPPRTLGRKRVYPKSLLQSRRDVMFIAACGQKAQAP